MALDADTGKVVWEYKFNLFQSDVPPHRIGWASPAADPETGNIYALSGGAQVIALNKDGKLLWQRSSVRSWRPSRRTAAGPCRLWSTAISSSSARRFRTGEPAPTAPTASSRSTSGPEMSSTSPTPAAVLTTRPTPSPLIATINGVRQLIVGLGDGAIHAIKPQTGQKIWSFVAAKRAINTGVVVKGQQRHRFAWRREPRRQRTGHDCRHRRLADRRHQDDEVGRQRYRVRLLVSGDRRHRVYQIDNSSRLKAFDIETGKELWTQPLGTAQKAPPVLADGKIYVGTDSGKVFHRPAARRPRGDPELGGNAGQQEQLLRLRRARPSRFWRRRRFRAAASSSCRATRSMRSVRGRQSR